VNSALYVEVEMFWCSDKLVFVVDGLWVERIKTESNPAYLTYTSCTHVSSVVLWKQGCLLNACVRTWCCCGHCCCSLQESYLAIKTPQNHRGYLFDLQDALEELRSYLSPSAASSTHLPDWCIFVAHLDKPGVFYGR